MTIEDRLVRLIETGGPIPLSTYMQIALHDPQGGYYAARPGIGRDFTTAPETSQIFGELIGLWLVHEWRAMGAPETFQLVEIGPGRGQLMLDALRAAGTAGGKAFAEAMQLVFVEPSPVLAGALSQQFAPSVPSFAATLAQVPEGPALIVANEYLDCLPVRQFRKAGETWRECVIGLDTERRLAFGLAADEPRPPHGTALAGDAVEVQTGLDLVVADLVSRRAPVRALFIDYGPSEAAPGDTLRAYREGRQVSPLEAPGVCDLTVDVDFGRFARLAVAAGLDVAGPTPQGMFLLGLGAQARLNQLVAADPENAEQVFEAARKLIDPKDMGARFKAICLSSAGLPVPAGF
ncbi:MAG: SAM-dependent methyltransferase [Hyphomonas sp.]|uniref:class I SAM-dependent methyltransferase n=1 Tax=Hyphomonas sp. TaxID=87 RepID=UPI0017D0E6F9|nr:SAM-dependent methyltransferase [Hyphomonas sp.]MBA3069169.1 SAM-dependent methyltransferase [Hyphomonas sp.]MBU3921034.1 SAM-dependent methyltransferase [Alphaproteobacteria bacterium]MBU4062354.1 SAM-dependent methyltransferase [Alphaproteobacteria bacterium]MBU4162736.1 SAM-dependent methyltransferase [Alphaproteobacteria bacterium]